MTNKEIKKIALAKLGKDIRSDNFVFFAFVLRIAVVIMSIISFIVLYYQNEYSIKGIIGIIISIIIVIINFGIPYVPFQYSFDRKMIKVYDNDFKYDDFLYYYENKPLSVIAVELYKGLYIFLWVFTIIGPIIKVFSYSMAEYIKIENPDLTANECITESRKMMDGYKFDLFCLYLSFIGWLLLSILTLGAIYPFVSVYIKASEIEFYNYVKNVDDEIDTDFDTSKIENDTLNIKNENSAITYESVSNNHNTLKNKSRLFIITIFLSMASFVVFNYLNNKVRIDHYNKLENVEVISHNSILGKFMIHIKNKKTNREEWQVTFRLY